MTKVIRLPAPHPRFRPRLEGGIRRPSHPGTAVRIGQDLYEIVKEEKSGEDWIYRLEPWTAAETIRVYIEWSEESEREFVAGLRKAQIQRRKDFLTWASQIFLGFLPAKHQERLSQERGLDPARATLWSATLETLVAAPFAIVFIISLFAGGMGKLGLTLPAWAGWLAAVATAEGVFRLATAFSTEEPVGSLFLAPLGLRFKSDDPLEGPHDEILAVEDEMTIISPIPKVWWEKAGGVTYGGKSYVLKKWDRDGRSYVYRFQKGGEGFPILDPELEKVRNTSSDRSYVFAPLWGFLPSGLQTALEFYGRYRPQPYVILSIVFNFLAALALIGPGWRNMSVGIFELWPLLKLAVAVLLFLESLLRLLRLMTDGQASGSVIAVFIKPLYDLMFKDRPGKDSSGSPPRRTK